MGSEHQKLQRHEQAHDEARYHHPYRPHLERHQAEEEHEGERGDEEAEGRDTCRKRKEKVGAIDVAGSVLGVKSGDEKSERKEGKRLTIKVWRSAQL